jgi:hypothetical protein
VVSDRGRRRCPPTKNLTEADIQHLIAALGDILDVLRDADPADKARVYAELRLRLTYQPARPWAMGCVRGGLDYVSVTYLYQQGMHVIN